MLTGRRPFRGQDQEELLHRVATENPEPPRPFDESLPRELERICLKAMSKRIGDRYRTASDLTVDLQQYLADDSSNSNAVLTATGSSESTPSGLFPASSNMPLSSSDGSSIGLLQDSQQLNIVPRGLRSFDENDAAFFLALLPGVGFTFLEETFNARTANPDNRIHLTAAQRILNELIPDIDTDIKGQMRSIDDLLQVSGYRDHPQSFEDLIRILDHELRLITPTEGELKTGNTMMHKDSGPRIPEHGGSSRYYQLSHDYLVPVLREWITHKQKATVYGRAELKLAERAETWHTRRESRYLPAWWEYISIVCFTRRAVWTKPQKQMMQTARRVHGLQWAGGLMAAVMLVSSVLFFVRATQLQHIEERTSSAVAGMSISRSTAVPRAIADLREFPQNIVIEKLRDRMTDAPPDEKLALSFALAEFGLANVDFLVNRIPSMPADEVANLITALQSHATGVVKQIHTAALTGERNWARKARYAIVTLHLKDTTLSLEMCSMRPDPIQRTAFIDQLSSWHGELSQLAAIAGIIDSPDLQSALCMGTGGASNVSLTQGNIETWKPLLDDWFSNSPDKAVRSAAGWMLRQWDLELPIIASSVRPSANQTRHVN